MLFSESDMRALIKGVRSDEWIIQVEDEDDGPTRHYEIVGHEELGPADGHDHLGVYRAIAFRFKQTHYLCYYVEGNDHWCAEMGRESWECTFERPSDAPPMPADIPDGFVDCPPAKKSRSSKMTWRAKEGEK